MNQSSARLILITPPELRTKAAETGLPMAHMTYQLGPGARLLRSRGTPPPKGGLMMIEDGGFDGRGDARTFSQAVFQECRNQSFRGVVLDLEAPPKPLLARIISGLEETCTRQSWFFYLPEAYCLYSNRAKIMVSTALSGGSLRRRLEEAGEKYGRARLVPYLQRVAEDFHLPAQEGRGYPLTREALISLRNRLSPTVFFSQDLCAYYFTYMSRDTGAHFVLFDNATSLRRKMEIASSLGLGEFVLVYPEVQDILPELLSR